MAPSKDLWIGIPRHIFHDIPKELLRMSAASVLRRPDVLLQARWQFNYLLGEAMEAHAITRGAAPAEKTA
jgi:hypothetical protein